MLLHRLRLKYCASQIFLRSIASIVSEMYIPLAFLFLSKSQYKKTCSIQQKGTRILFSRKLQTAHPVYWFFITGLEERARVCVNLFYRGAFHL